MSDKLISFETDNAEYIGIAFTGGRATGKFWNITCPCGVKVEYGLNELPTSDMQHPCGNPKHFTVKFFRVGTE